MADFERIIITKTGQQIMSDVIAGKMNLKFSKFVVSEDDHSTETDDTKENVSELKGNQSTTAMSIRKSGDLSGKAAPAIEISASFDNKDLTTGYYMRTIGLYVHDQNSNEVLYAYAPAKQPGYMPPYNGKTVSGAMFRLTITVGNADKVTLIQGSNYVKREEFEDLSKDISDLRSDIERYIGYNDEEIYGVEVDYENNKITRLGAAAGKSAGKDFDGIGPWNRKECMVDVDTEKVIVYEGDPNFSETGKLKNDVKDNEGNTYSKDEYYPVMVEQPKFYYNIVPLKLSDNGKGIPSIDKARYYISSYPLKGFKEHPAFKYDNALGTKSITDKLYISAFHASPYNDGRYTSNNSATLTELSLDEFQDGLDTNLMVSGLDQYSATQLLELIEYADFKKIIALTEYRKEKELDHPAFGADYLFKYNKQRGLTMAYSNNEEEIITFNPDSAGYISRFGYLKNMDWLFIPVEGNGNAEFPVGEIFAYATTERSYMSLADTFYTATGDKSGARLKIDPKGAE